MANWPWEMLSAIGTLAAVVVALCVAGHANYVNRRVDRDRSELVAAKMLSSISSLESKASYLWAWFLLDDVEPAEGHLNILLAINELETMAGAVSIDDLYPLLHLKGHAAKRAAMALGLIQSFSAEASALISHHSWSDASRRKALYQKWASSLGEIKDHLSVAESACRAAASVGAPRPTPEELHG